MTHRWPLHPPPGHGEALSSWLHRLATVYGMPLDQLVRHDLTPPGAPVPGSIGSLDLEVPSELITILAARTGVPPAQVRRMTVAGWVPWLLDSLQPEPTPGAAFDTYVRQGSVIVTFKERPHREVLNWRAWLPLNSKNRPVSRACPACVGSATDGVPADCATSHHAHLPPPRSLARPCLWNIRVLRLGAQQDERPARSATRRDPGCTH